MKVNFSTLGVGVAERNFARKSGYAGNPAASKIQNNNNDLFIKSSQDVAFTSWEEDIEEFYNAKTATEVRPSVVRRGVESIRRYMTAQAKTSGNAHGRKFPIQEDLDDAMKTHFETTILDDFSYPRETIPTLGRFMKQEFAHYPNEKEFVEMMQRLWLDSNGSEGAYMEKYAYVAKELKDVHDAKVLKIRIAPFVKDDMARALNVYAEDKYGIKIKNKEDVVIFAREMYKDKNLVKRRLLDERETKQIEKKLQYLNSFELVSYMKDQKDIALKEGTSDVFCKGESLYDLYWENQNRFTAYEQKHGSTGHPGAYKHTIEGIHKKPEKPEPKPKREIVYETFDPCDPNEDWKNWPFFD